MEVGDKVLSKKKHSPEICINLPKVYNKRDTIFGGFNMVRRKLETKQPTTAAMVTAKNHSEQVWQGWYFSPMMPCSRCLILR
jgi:hypothetical protein